MHAQAPSNDTCMSMNHLYMIMIFNASCLTIHSSCLLFYIIIVWFRTFKGYKITPLWWIMHKISQHRFIQIWFCFSTIYIYIYILFNKWLLFLVLLWPKINWYKFLNSWLQVSDHHFAQSRTSKRSSFDHLKNPSLEFTLGRPDWHSNDQHD